GGRPRVQVHVLLRPPKGGARAGVRESVSDRIDSLWRPRRARARRRPPHRATARHGDERRHDLQPEGVERRRHARLVPRARQPARVQPAGQSGDADDALEGCVARRGDRRGGNRGRDHRRGCVGRPQMSETSYDLPLLKPPVWTWEVPAYFFAGGAAGASAVIGAAARFTGADPALVRDARRIAAIGSMISAPLLIADLGRPERFLNMLRRFKPQSPMSVGAWPRAVFGGACAGAAILRGRLGDAAAVVSAATGLVMSTYTGVLLGATAIPVWAEHKRTLPIVFGASALASAVALLELRGHD